MCERTAGRQRLRRWWPAAVAGAILLGEVMPLQAASERELQVLSRNGKAALEDGQYELAEKLFRQWAEAVPPQSPSAADARIGLARAAYGRKAYREMLEILAPGQAPKRGQPFAAAYRYHRALALVELESLDEALAELDDPDMAADTGPLAADASRLRAWIYLRQAKWPEADRAFAAWDTRAIPEPARSVQTVAWAEALTGAGRFREATDALQRVLERKPGEPLVWRVRYGLARAWLGLNQPDAAEAELAAILAPPVSPAIRLDAWLVQASLEEGRTNWAAACAAASNAAALSVEPAAARRARTAWGLILLRSGALNEGAERLKGVIAEAPADPQAPALQLTVARAFLDAGLAAEAEANYRHYLESFTNTAGVAEAQEGRAWAFFGLERYAESAAAFEKAAELIPEPARRARLIFKAGDACFANRQYQLAADAYRRAMAFGGDPALGFEARSQLAETEARQGRFEAARTQFEALERECPGTEIAERAALRMAELRQDAGELAAARTAYDRFLAVYTNSPRVATALYNRGLVAFQIYLFDEALADFEAVLDRFPDSPIAENAAYMRVCGAFETYANERAAQLAGEFLETRPQSIWVPQIRFRLAEYAFNRGKYGEAEKGFLGVADGDPRDASAGDALFWAAQAAAAQKQYKRAVEHDSRLVREFPDHSKVVEALFFQAEWLVELGDYADAIALFEEVIRRQPDSFLAFAARGRRGDCQFTLGADDPARFEDAIRAYGELAENPKTPFELRLQAAFKLGRGEQKLGRLDKAFERYYTGVILAYLDARQAGEPMNESCTAWFTRAAFEAAAILESKGQWRRAVRLYQRVADAGVPAGPDARARIETIRREHWRFF